MKPCRSSPPRPAITRLRISIHVEPHPIVEHLATSMLLNLLGELAANGIGATNIAVQINGYEPAHPRVP